jgi:hypothetical protein
MIEVIDTNYSIASRMNWSETVFEGDRRGCFNKLISMGKDERDSIVVTIRNKSLLDGNSYDLSMSGDDFIRANIEDMLRRLALEQGLDEGHYLQLRDTLGAYWPYVHHVSYESKYA